MPNYGNRDTLKVYFSLISTQELIRLRHEAIRINDTSAKDLIDEELKKRDIENA